MLDWLDFLWSLAATVCDVFFQKLFMRDLPPIGGIEGDIKGLTMIVTGPTSGIGRETALSLLTRGAHVVLACRSSERGQKLRGELEREATAAGTAAAKVEVALLDVADLASVRSFASAWVASKRPLHVLINNAGVFDMTGPRLETSEGFEAHLATNHLGSALLILLLLPVMKASGSKGRPARVVNVSSHVHYMGRLHPHDMHLRCRRYFPLVAYAQSKLAQVMFTAELQRRLGPGAGVAAMSLHPGEIHTNIVRGLPSVVRSLYELILPRILLTPAQGARCSVYCAISPAALHAHAENAGCYFHSNCQAMTPSKLVSDRASMEWLWDWTVETTKVPKEQCLSYSIGIVNGQKD